MENWEESMLQRAVRLAVEVAVVISLAWFCVYAFATRTTVPGQSMRPVLEDGDEVLIDRMRLHFGGLKRYDIILFLPGQGGGPNIKRIIGLPGETVQIAGGRVTVDGEPLSGPAGERWAAASAAGLAEQPVTLGEDEYFVLGDNRDVSEDSRYETVGNVTLREIVGRIWFRTAPFDAIGLPDSR